MIFFQMLILNIFIFLGVFSIILPIVSGHSFGGVDITIVFTLFFVILFNLTIFLSKNQKQKYYDIIKPYHPFAFYFILFWTFLKTLVVIALIRN